MGRKTFVINNIFDNEQQKEQMFSSEEFTMEPSMGWAVCASWVDMEPKEP